MITFALDIVLRAVRINNEPAGVPDAWRHNMACSAQSWAHILNEVTGTVPQSTGQSGSEGQSTRTSPDRKSIHAAHRTGGDLWNELWNHPFCLGRRARDCAHRASNPTRVCARNIRYMKSLGPRPPVPQVRADKLISRVSQPLPRHYNGQGCDPPLMLPSRSHIC